MVQTLRETVEETRLAAAASKSGAEKSDLGQFLTPADVASLMASMFDPFIGDTLRVLDPGAGVGSLTVALVNELRRRGFSGSLNATAFELDERVMQPLTAMLRHISIANRAGGLVFDSDIRHEDFISAAVAMLDGGLFANAAARFDLVIMNPPYKKIATDSRERQLVKRVGLDATNIYAAFVALALRLLRDGGQLVAIIPRSFCNGPYFRPFRQVLLAEAALRRIHVFESRKTAFKEDGVLQENVIIHVVRTSSRPIRVCVSESRDAVASVRMTDVAYEEVVRDVGGDRFIHIPTTSDDDRPGRRIESLPATLATLGIDVSTGRVVDFRAREHLRSSAAADTVPLIYPCHFAAGVVRWPKANTKKPNAIVRCDATSGLLVPSGHYVLTKRFTTKEEKRRLVAVVHEPAEVNAPLLGFENHVNYFHSRGRPLDRDLAYGLSAFLNSSALDRYFREFNGHTQVNATDLRSLRYPSLDSLRRVGRAIKDGATAANGHEFVD